MTISATKERARPEMMLLFDSMTPVWYGLAVGIFRPSVTFQKLFDFFVLAAYPHRDLKVDGFGELLLRIIFW
jgi:hypothetical protein